jgi:polyisoprenoid-binding protein YceI
MEGNTVSSQAERLHMTRQFITRTTLGSALALSALALGATATAQAPLALGTAKITIAGTSNVHDYTATTTTATITAVKLGAAVAGEGFWDEVQKPGALEAFDIAIPAETLKSSKEGLDKNMYKALKTKEHKHITFSLKSLTGAPGALTATGILTVAGVEREVTLPLKTVQKGDRLAVSGTVVVLMTDHGIKPPTAMLGMVKADPKITVTFEVLLGVITT